MPPMIDLKQCADCQAIKPVTEFKAIDKGKEYTRSYCGDCAKARGREAMRRFRNRKFQPKYQCAPGMKKCSTCKAEKPREESYHKNAARKDGFCNVCIECMRTGYRKTYLKRAYDLTEEEYQAKLDEQLGVCAICQGLETVIHMNDKEPRLSVDHNHETGAIRGLLCYRCNHLAGYLERYTPEEVAAAQAYLRHHESPE